MAAVLGNNIKFFIKSSSSPVWLSGEQSNSFTMSCEAIETSDKSSAWATFIGGKRSASGSVTVFADMFDDNQLSVLSALTSGQSITCYVGREAYNAAAAKMKQFDAIITEVSDTNDFGAVATRQISFQVTGEVTDYTA